MPGRREKLIWISLMLASLCIFLLIGVDCGMKYLPIVFEVFTVNNLFLKEGTFLFSFFIIVVFTKRLISHRFVNLSNKGKMNSDSGAKSPTPPATPQKIRFLGTDNDSSQQVTSKDVTVVVSTGNHESGSSKVKLKNIVDFSWDYRFYTGQLLAVHSSGKYIGYGLKGAGSNKTSGVVRVVKLDTNERALLKGSQGMVVDVAFACIPTEIVLGSVDEFGNLSVSDIKESSNNGLVCTLLLQVTNVAEYVPNMVHRIIWCPYIPDDEGEELEGGYNDTAKLLALIHGPDVELWNVPMVTEKYGIGPLESESVEEGFLSIKDHEDAIIDASFSPDGTAVATASVDGYVKFFQVYMHSRGKPQCLHKWQPFNGKPLSCLFFLDNHKIHQPDAQFWKFVITGTDNNSELRLWSCESWTCLQTIKFTTEIGKKDVTLKAGLDLAAKVLLLSDINRRILYVVQIDKDEEDTTAFIRTISEFLLPNPFLSFGIVEAGFKKFQNSALNFDDIIEDESEDISKAVKAMMVKMFLVHPKSLQECHIVYDPIWPEEEIKIPPETATVLEGLNGILKPKDTLLNNFTDAATVPEMDLLDMKEDLPANHMFDPLQSNHKTQQQPVLNLMTPDAFFSSIKNENSFEITSSKPSESSEKDNILPAKMIAAINTLGQISSPSAVNLMTSSSPVETTRFAEIKSKEKSIENGLESEKSTSVTRQGIASGNSSPSREVQEILSLSNEFYGKQNSSSSGQPVDELQMTSSVKVLEETVIPHLKEDSNLKSVNSFTDGWPSAPPLPCVTDVLESSISNENLPSKRVNLDDMFEENMQQDNSQYVADSQISSQQLQHLLSTVKLLDAKFDMYMSKIPDIQQKQQDNFIYPSAEVEKLQEYRFEQQATLIRRLFEEKEQQDLKREKDLMTAISQTVGNLVTSKLDEIIIEEFNNNVVPTMRDSLDVLKESLHGELTQKLTATDHLLKENISRLVNSKSVMEVLSTSLVNTLQPYIHTTFKSIFQSVLLPGIEKTCQNMLLQMNDIFSKGTRDYILLLENHLEKQLAQKNKGRDTHAQSLYDSVQGLNEQLFTALRNEMQAQAQKGIEDMRNTVSSCISEKVKENMKVGIKAQCSLLEEKLTSVIQSRSVTPAPSILDFQAQQAQIMQLITQGQLNAAFQQALSASDLDLVVFVCEKVNPQQVFNQEPCPLQQEVLLSLIQQLSADMSNYSETRHRYLEEAVMNLDRRNPLTQTHMNNILTNLKRQLNNYTVNNPNNKLSRNVKMLSMAAEAIMYSRH